MPRPAPFDYAGWPALTAEPVRVDVQMFSYCRVPRELQQRGPHGVPIARYLVSPASADAVRSGAAPVPVGTTVVKEKRWEGNGQPTAVAAMVKREPGYDPGNGDWEYVYTFQPAEGQWATERGKLASCIDCHRNAREKDYLFRTYLKK
jgi:hypothetical protein